MWLGNRYMSEKRGICDINPKLKLLFPHRITKRAALLRLSWGREVGRRCQTTKVVRNVVSSMKHQL